MVGADHSSRMQLVLLAVSAVFLFAPAARAEGAFTFVPDPSQPTLPAGSMLVGVADLTGNGVPDLIVENQRADTLGVMLGNGAGGFGPASSIALGGRPWLVQVADFNDDGHPDLLVPIETKSEPRELNPLPEHMEILFGDGAGNFTVGPQIALPEAGPVAVGDFTGDGNADVVVAPDGCWGGNNDSKYYMLLGDGHGDLTPGPTTLQETSGCAPEVGDFTGDGRDDLVIYSPGHRGETGAVELLPGEPAGGFGAAIASPAEGTDLVAGPADLNGDGHLGLILQGFSEPGSFAVLSGDGTGRFTVAHQYASGQGNLFSSFAVGDFSGDGQPDIATIGKSGIAVLENNGAGGFSPGPLVASAAASGDDDAAFVADVNGDGRPDLILAGPSTASVSLDEPVTSQPAASPRRSAHFAASLRLSRRAHGGRRSLRVDGRLLPGQGLAASDAVCSGQVSIRVSLHGRTLARKTVALTGACTFSGTLAIGARELRRGSRPTVSLWFAGNAYLLAASGHRQI